MENYNARIVELHRCHDELMIIRVQPDVPRAQVLAGQYLVLGLMNWEPRVEGCQAEPEMAERSLIRRAYSVSCSMLNADDELQTIQMTPWYEFFISLVRKADTAPALTPRLFALRTGSQIFCGTHVAGRYTVEGIDKDCDVLFVATGTGEAPHNAMVAQLLSVGHRGRIVSVNCVRYAKDLGYLDLHRRVEARYSNYTYVPLTTREPQNTDRNRSDYVGKMYPQEFLESGRLAELTGLGLDPRRCHVFLCGSPDMIGRPMHSPDGRHGYSVPGGMVELIERRGFHIDTQHEAGNIHFETYW